MPNHTPWSCTTAASHSPFPSPPSRRFENDATFPCSYDAPLAAGRWGLWAAFLPAALAALAAFEWWLAWIGGARPSAAALAGAAAITALFAPWLFPRMAVLPAHLLAATLRLAACHRLGAFRVPAIAGAVMAAVVFARLAAGVDALYRPIERQIRP